LVYNKAAYCIPYQFYLEPLNALTVAPIDTSLQDEVIRRTNEMVFYASGLFSVNLQRIPVSFDLKGRAAGMFCIKSGQRRIRYNPWIFSKHFDENLSQTVPHEVAHYVVEQLFGRRGIRPHGNEWQNVMIALGYEPRTTCDFDLGGIPGRKLKYYRYHCQCRNHQVSSIRHNRMRDGKAQYFCRSCRYPLKPAAPDHGE